MAKQDSVLSQNAKLTPAQRIWHTVRLIPKGSVMSYGKVADLAGLPGRARYVGYCLRNAPESSLLPWHRVLRSNGELAFKGGSPTAMKQQTLLEAEEILVQNNRVNIKVYGWEPSLDVLLHQLRF